MSAPITAGRLTEAAILQAFGRIRLRQGVGSREVGRGAYRTVETARKAGSDLRGAAGGGKVGERKEKAVSSMAGLPKPGRDALVRPSWYQRLR